ncbi:hypothetical protein ACPWT1_08525 [Ramlibacter sp. MMS24-I3-19]|uniref:hypothetical protein n=1 Tax=Ramlibacter sp. MMS24-I3-19 TaxID=3416606 RepID=UPI003CFBDC22
MKNRTLQACIVAALAVPAVVAFAQTGEADASGCRATPSKSTTAQERADARAARTAEGTTVARAGKTDDDPCAMGAARSVSREERKEAAKERKAEASDAVRKGEISSGDSAGTK